MSYSPHGSTPGREYYEDYPSASPTPSPRGMFGIMPQQRPATRAHFRSTSIPYNSEFSSRMPTPSPRFNSQGEYATVSTSRSSREHSSSSSRHKRDRRSSISFTRVNSHWNTEGAGDGDDVVYGRLPDGFVWVERRSHQLHRQRKRSGSGYDTDYSYGGWQGGYTPTRDAGYASPRPEPVARPETRAEVRPEVRRTTTTRRNSTAANIPRPQTARPASSHRKPSSAHPAQPAHPAAQPPPRKATETDAKLHKIPPGYSLRHWDPSEQPICLLGSVFDANSLGKWIYDWTVFHHGPGTPLSEVAGDLWLLLIQLFGKLKRAEDTMPEIRSKEKKEMVEDFIQSGERLTDKLRKLLKACEAPMLKASKRDGKQLGHDAGIEFVLTLFGHEREMERTERLMQSLRLWILRFNANCEQVLNKPTL